MPPKFILGGKAGDVVQCLGAFHAIHERTGLCPVVITAEEFASIYDGTSYVNAIAVHGDWQTVKSFTDAVPLQPWHDFNAPEFQAGRFRRGVPLTMNGRSFTSPDPHYGAAMMRAAGLTWDEALKLRPVFDRRDANRESHLLARCYPEQRRSKPLLLLALDGQSSPWGYLPEAYRVLHPLYRHFHICDIGKLRATRVYDMLVLMEHAVGLITVDTLALHLVSATDLPHIAFTQVGWLSSVPKGNCVLQIPYNQTLRRLHEVKGVLENWKSEHSPTQLLVSQGR